MGAVASVLIRHWVCRSVCCGDTCTGREADAWQHPHCAARPTLAGTPPHVTLLAVLFLVDTRSNCSHGEYLPSLGLSPISSLHSGPVLCCKAHSPLLLGTLCMRFCMLHACKQDCTLSSRCPYKPSWTVATKLQPERCL